MYGRVYGGLRQNVAQTLDSRKTRPQQRYFLTNDYKPISQIPELQTLERTTLQAIQDSAFTKVQKDIWESDVRESLLLMKPFLDAPSGFSFSDNCQFYSELGAKIG